MKDRKGNLNMDKVCEKTLICKHLSATELSSASGGCHQHTEAEGSLFSCNESDYNSDVIIVFFFFFFYGLHS